MIHIFLIIATTLMKSTSSYSDSDVMINEVKTLDQPSMFSISKDRKFAVDSEIYPGRFSMVSDDDQQNSGPTSSTTTSSTTALLQTTTQGPRFAPAQEWPVLPSSSNETSPPLRVPVQAVFPMTDPMTLLHQGQMLNPMFHGMSPFGGGMPMPVSPVIGYQEFLGRFLNPFHPSLSSYAVPLPEQLDPVVSSEVVDDTPDANVEASGDTSGNEATKSDTKPDEAAKTTALKLTNGCVQNCQRSKTGDHCTIVCNPSKAGNTGQGTFFQWNRPF